ncbi:MAG: hypothetical protein ACREUY_05095 [Burkholderiales bacterium]
MSVILQDVLRRGKTYTFVFKVSFYKPLTDTIIERLAPANLLGNPSASYSGGIGGLFGDKLSVSFVWNGYGGTAENTARQITELINAGLGDFVFIEAKEGDATSICDFSNPTKLVTCVVVAVVLAVIAAAFARGAGESIGARFAGATT